jgi:hypothetical protein
MDNREMTSTGQRQVERWNRVDVVLLALVALASLSALYVLSFGGHIVMYDTFRDMAWARAMSAGEIFKDPILAGETFWYPPGNPLLFAAITVLSGVDASVAYASSALWWNFFIPVLIFVLVRNASDRTTALLAVPFVWLGSLWWLTHMAAPMPSIQGAVLELFSFWLWQRAQLSTSKASQGYVVACAVVLGFSAWWHPIGAMVAAGAIGGHALYGIAAPSIAGAQLSRSGWMRAFCAVAGLSALIALPLIWHLATLPDNNPLPRRYVAAEIFNPDFALQMHAPLVLPLALIGLVTIVRTMRNDLWILFAAVTGIAGQLPPYLERLKGHRLPLALPHEFQWHTQLVLAMSAAVGLAALARWLAARISWPTDPALAKVLWVVGISIAALGPATEFVPVSRAYYVDLRSIMAIRGDLVEWLRSNTPPDSTVACRGHHGYMLVAGLAGRRCIAVPIGFMNPSADVKARQSDLATMLETQSEAEFLEVANRYGVNHLVVIVDSTEAAALFKRAMLWTTLVPVFRSSTSAASVFRIDRGRPPS